MLLLLRQPLTRKNPFSKSPLLDRVVVQGAAHSESVSSPKSHTSSASAATAGDRRSSSKRSRRINTRGAMRIIASSHVVIVSTRHKKGARPKCRRRHVIPAEKSACCLLHQSLDQRMASCNPNGSRTQSIDFMLPKCTVRGGTGAHTQHASRVDGFSEEFSYDVTLIFLLPSPCR